MDVVDNNIVEVGVDDVVISSRGECNEDEVISADGCPLFSARLDATSSTAGETGQDEFNTGEGSKDNDEDEDDVEEVIVDDDEDDECIGSNDAEAEEDISNDRWIWRASSCW